MLQPDWISDTRGIRDRVWSAFPIDGLPSVLNAAAVTSLPTLDCSAVLDVKPLDKTGVDHRIFPFR
ncbi:hypothetical protein [Paracoccus sp. TOH]|uniref:hypothetical protein n=1 Tax=Paracoccus sp. TOH TaxID=1263728 RepID=UPI0025B0AFF6|nr:hypothetical protein [Paracoccus sp. TOH]WJS87135.1 hypothetical protein NBE95_21140 [Paracoccus sp. TOH]